MERWKTGPVSAYSRGGKQSKQAADLFRGVPVAAPARSLDPTHDDLRYKTAGQETINIADRNSSTLASITFPVYPGSPDIVRSHTRV